MRASLTSQPFRIRSTDGEIGIGASGPSIRAEIGRTAASGGTTGSVFESVVATEPSRCRAAALPGGADERAEARDREATSDRERARGDGQQPKHASSGPTRPLLSEPRVFHAAAGVNPTPVEAVTPAKE